MAPALVRKALARAAGGADTASGRQERNNEMLQNANLGLRFALELMALVFYGVWGFQTGESSAMRTALGVGTPLLVAAVWGLFIAPRARVTLNPVLKEALALAVFAGAAFCLAALGYTTLGWLFVITALLNSYALRKRDA